MLTAISPTARAAQAATNAHDILAKLIAEFPEDKAAYQSTPAENHLLWHVGHMIVTYQWFAAGLDGQPVGVSEQDNALFGMGSKPNPDARAYPSLASLRTRFEAAWKRFSTAAHALRDEDAGKPATIDSNGYLKDRLDVVEKCAWHDGWHAGQISTLRKSLGLKPMWG
jgi:hypothetical protein